MGRGGGRGGGSGSSGSRPGGSGGGGRGFSSRRSSPGSSRGMSSGGRSSGTRSSGIRSSGIRSSGSRPISPGGPQGGLQGGMGMGPGGHWGAPPPPRRGLFGGFWGAPPPPPPYGYGYYGRRPYGYGYYGHGCGCGFFLILLVVAVLLGGIIKLLTFLDPNHKSTLPDENPPAIVAEEPAGKEEAGHTSVEEVPENKGLWRPERVKREKLEAEACTYTEAVMDDRLDWLSDTEAVEQAMEYFYEKTGVQPYLLICDSLGGKGGEITDSEAEQSLQQLYDSLYADEGHMIFVFMEYEESEYITYLYTGRDADRVMDEQARNTFLDYADEYYTDSSLSDEEYFAKVFRTSADSIMF